MLNTAFRGYKKGKENFMAWEFKNDRPIYTQILENIEMGIISGKYMPGDKLPSVRELAADASVNPNTMQKALAELERRNLVRTERTSGRFITDDEEVINMVKDKLANGCVLEFVGKMEGIGYDVGDIIELIERYGKEE